MSISAASGPSPSGVVVAAREQVAALTDLLWSAQTDDELVGVVEQVQTMRSTLAAVEAAAVVEVEARGIARSKLHYGSTGDWLTHVGGLRRGEGRRRVVRAQALAGDCARTSEALADGSISPEQAEVIAAAVESLPSGELIRARGERFLIERSSSLDASELTRAGRHLAHVVDPDREERRLEAQLARDERAAHARRFFAITEDGAGGVRVKGRGSVEDCAVLKAALLPLTAPVASVDPETGEEVRDVRDHGARLWDALVALAQHALDTDLPPATHGARPRLVVTVAHEALVSDLTGAAVTDDGSELSAGAVRRLACDADLLPVVLGTASEVLDVGRTHRLVTTPIWQALVARDRHCTFPSCTRPPLMCHAHHIVHWLSGGPTCLDNLALLCGHHHRVIHDSPWEIRLNSCDRKPEFVPPPRFGGSGGAIRERVRRQ